MYVVIQTGNQDSGLTDGQEKAVARNDENIKKLIDEIAELVDTIKNKVCSLMSCVCFRIPIVIDCISQSNMMLLYAN